MGSDIRSHQPETRRKGEKGEQSNREYSSKVLASKELHYICKVICVKGHISGLNCRMPELKRGIASPVEDYASGHLHLAADRRE